MTLVFLTSSSVTEGDNEELRRSSRDAQERLKVLQVESSTSTTRQASSTSSSSPSPREGTSSGFVAGVSIVALLALVGIAFVTTKRR